MKTIHVPIPGKEYDVIIGKGLIKEVERHLDPTKNYVIITDNNIPLAYINDITSKMNVLNTYTIPAGEASKSMETASLLLNSLVNDSITRDAIIIALGGGVVGDLAGFVASTYMRGIGFIQIPTSLLAQVDSSVGGKVGINADSMKNAIGSFYQPKLVLIDPDTLKTLEPRHLNNGVAEIIKHGLINGKSLFEDLLNNDLLDNIEDIIFQSITIKRDIVIQDEYDYGIRNLLNYAHTIGHAIEQDSQYSILHGEAISISMLKLSKDTVYEDKLRLLLGKHNLLINYDYDKDVLFSYIKTDKKIQQNNLNFVIVSSIGNGSIKQIKVEEIKEYL